MIISSIAEFCIQYDEFSDLLRVAWLAGHGMRHFQVAFSKLHRIIKRSHVSRIVLDLEAMPDIPVYDQLWLSTDFMPALLKLPLRQLVLVLSDKRVYNQHVVDGLLAAVANTLPFDVQFFAHPETAIAWLTDDSPRLPALFTEWASGCHNPSHPPSSVAEPQARYRARESANCQPGS